MEAFRGGLSAAEFGDRGKGRPCRQPVTWPQGPASVLTLWCHPPLQASVWGLTGPTHMPPTWQPGTGHSRGSGEVTGGHGPACIPGMPRVCLDHGRQSKPHQSPACSFHPHSRWPSFRLSAPHPAPLPRCRPCRAGIFAICGDQAVHLLWRLREGEGPAGLNPRAIAVMIGTNDAAHLASVYPARKGDLALRECRAPAVPATPICAPVGMLHTQAC